MILLQYGLPKSGSTFLTRILSEVCCIFGQEQKTLRARTESADLINQNGFLGKLEGLAEIWSRLPPDDYLVIKTHEAVTDEVVAMAEMGRLVPFISCRHPGDAALSAFEAGVKARRSGDTRQYFHKLDSHRKAIDFIASHASPNTLDWCRKFPGNIFEYEALTKDMDKVVDRVERLVGLQPGSLKDRPVVKRLYDRDETVYNFNVGVSGRYAAEFSEAEISYLRRRTADYIKELGY